MAMIEKGNIDLSKRAPIKNSDGSYSTVYSFSFTDDDGNEVLVPSVIGGKRVSPEEAYLNYLNTGKHLGKFDSIDASNEYAEQLHNSEATRTVPYINNDTLAQYLAESGRSPVADRLKNQARFEQLRSIWDSTTK